MIKIYINFITEGQGERQIQEPDGFDASKFSIEQEDKRYGRDILFAGGESNFGLNNRSKHYFELVLKYFEIYGFEAEAELIFRSGTIEKVYDIDFATMTTNQVDVIQFKAIQKSKEILLKRRSDVNVDLLSPNTLDKLPIFPCTIQKVFQYAKPLTNVSKWKQPKSKTYIQGGAGGSTIRKFNFANQVVFDGISNTLSFIQGGGQRRDFGYIEAQDNITNLTLRVFNFSVTSREISESYPLGNSGWNLRYAIVFPDIEPTFEYSRTLFFMNFFDTPENAVKNIINGEITVPNLTMERGQRLYIWFEQDVNTQNSIYYLETTVKSMEVEITAIQQSFNTITPAIRLYDAMKYICKSVADMEINAPEYAYGGYLYDQFIYTGRFLRNIITDGFKINFENITKSIVETNSDYQIQTNDNVFFGTYKNFYISKEIAVITGVQFEDYQKYFNERYKVNIFKYKYNNYQSQKEKETENTVDVVNGETEWLLMNKNVENKKEVEVDWIRDAFVIEESRTKAYIVSENVKAQDDDKIFISDVYPKEKINKEFLTFTETAFLKHFLDTSTGEITLTNNSSFSFLLLGIEDDSSIPFILDVPQPNQGIFNVSEVTTNYIVLRPGIGTIISPNNGERFTKFTYSVRVSGLAGVNWTDEGFTDIQNIANGNKFSNLRFTAKRNIVNYYSEYLATCNLFCRKEIDNTLYNNNPKAITVYDGIRVEEGAPFTPLNPILSPYEYNCQFTMSMSNYIDLENKIRDERGFIRFIDNKNNVVRGYIKKADLTNQIDEQGFLECIIEEKYQPAILSIFSDNLTRLIIFNEEISVDSDNWSWNFKDELDYLHIFDATGLLLFTPMHFSKVMVNGAIKETRIELEESLNLL